MQYFYATLYILFLFLPTFIANGAPVVGKNLPYIKTFSRPISEKYLWKNKTYRGFILWVLAAILTSLVQYYTSDFIFVAAVKQRYLETITSGQLAFFCGLLQWFWALFGDAVKSFFKRKLWKKPWESWPVFDGVDYILWSVFFFSVLYVPHILAIWVLLVIGPIASLIANTWAYIISWKDVRY